MTIIRKVVTASAIALVLASVPSYLAAQERESKAPAEARHSTFDWLSGAWSKIAALFATAPHPGTPGGPTTQGSCAVDPNGACTPGG
ncbi:MAG TPA: hypothetical protein VH988_00350 [Thermoanaerobaculia bacterium]|jgi:hypothetical protein|nr:hypothetical protein [Thermoanaerobaculia bacterium]